MSTTDHDDDQQASEHPPTATQGLLVDSFTRVAEAVHDTLDGVRHDDLVARLSPTANTISWLVWHLTRVQDDHVAAIAGTEQEWLRGGWKERFALPFEASDLGYGHTSSDVASVTPPAELLLGYFDAVHDATIRAVGSMSDARLDDVIDTSFDPPVTVAIRIVSVVSDCLQHAGQAAFVRGVLEGGWSTADG